MTATPTELTSARDDALVAVRARLHAFLARRVESPEAADDLTQDVLLRLLQHKDGSVDNPTAWLYRVARNVLIDHYRTRASQRRLHTGDPTTAATILAEEPFADDPQAAQRELAGCLRSLVDQLAEPYRSAVTAVDLDGQTQTNVARGLGLSVSGMKSPVQRGPTPAMPAPDRVLPGAHQPHRRHQRLRTRRQLRGRSRGAREPAVSFRMPMRPAG